MTDQAAERIEEAAAGIRDELQAENEKRDLNTKALNDRTTKVRTLALVAIAVGVIGILAGILGTNSASRANTAAVKAQEAADLAQLAIDQLAADRAQGQVNSCLAYNEGLATSNNKIVTELVQFVEFLGIDQSPETPRTPEEQARVDELISARIAEFETARVLFRDCSPEGIEAFSEGTGGYLLTGAEP